MNLSCLFCGNPIYVHKRMKPGDELKCSKCQTVFRLVGNSPFKIDWLQINEGNVDTSDEEESYFEDPN